MPDMMSAALEYGDQGVAIIPCRERSKKPALKTTGEAHADAATTDAQQIRRWWEANPNWNIGIPGTTNRLAVVDIDGPAGTRFIKDYELPMPTTWASVTTNGYHYYYRWPDDVEIRTAQIADKLEIRAAGAYVVAPPSTHPDGGIYEWSSQRCSFDDVPELPDEWVTLANEPDLAPNVVAYLETPLTSQHPSRIFHADAHNSVALKRLAGLAKHLADTREGTRHSALYTIARTLGQLVASKHLTPNQVHNALFQAAASNGLVKEDGHTNIIQTIGDGITKGVQDGPDLDHHETSEPNPFTLPVPAALPSALSAAEGSDGIHPLDLDKVITDDFDDTQWLIEPIVPAQRSVALYAAGKTGKSLLVLDMVAAAAAGRPILGGPALPDPVHVLYVDQEMIQSDLQERLHNLGYDEPDAALREHLHYYQLAPWPDLDTQQGGQRLLAEALAVGAQLVVIDTLIRTVGGEENSADTIKHFNKFTGSPLKAAGIALLRIAHAGKDSTRKQRGTSAAQDDVDVVWLLKPAAASLPGKTMLILKREASRVDWIQEDLAITRVQGPPLTHTVGQQRLELNAADHEIVSYLQSEGLFRDNVSNAAAREALNRSEGVSARGTRLAYIIKWMKRYGDTPTETPRDTPRDTPGHEEARGVGHITPPKGGVIFHPGRDTEPELPIPW